MPLWCKIVSFTNCSHAYKTKTFKFHPGSKNYFCLFQFTHWVDAVIFVFSLENETSFQAIYNFYAKMAHYRNTAEIPLILVGTQGNVTSRFVI